MGKFYLILLSAVEEYDRFRWFKKIDGRWAFFIRLVGIKWDKEIKPIYKPLISAERRADQLLIEIAFTVWVSWLILIDRNGVHTSVFDLRKRYQEEEDE